MAHEASTPLRILVGVHGLPPDSVGGTELSTLALARALAERAQVTLFYPMLNSDLPAGSTHQRQELLPGGGILRLIGRRLSPPTSFRQTWSHSEAEAWFEELLEGTDPDVIHLHHLSGLSMRFPHQARARGIPCILTLHDYWMPCARGQLLDLDLKRCPGPTPADCATCLSDQLLLEHPSGRALRAVLQRLNPPQALVDAASLLRETWLRVRRTAPQPTHAQAWMAETDARSAAARSALLACSAVTSPSRDLLERFITLGLKPSPGLPRLEVIPHGFERTTPAGRPSVPPPLRVIFVGAMIPSKGPQVLLEAQALLEAQGLPRTALELTLVGPRPHFHRRPGFAAQLEAQALRQGARMLETRTPQQLGVLLESSHVLVLPAIWPENAPLVIGEALARGVPVVASQIGGIPELLIDGYNGLLVPPGDEGALAQALKGLLETPERLSALQKGAERSHLPQTHEQLECWWTLYQALVDQARGP